jgi:hypothetical protein
MSEIGRRISIGRGASPAPVSDDFPARHFVVADITGARGGVYFEAGFAKALSRDLFFCCRSDRFDTDRHFDTEHFQHTLWATPADLRAKLCDKVLGLKGVGPYGNRVSRYAFHRESRCAPITGSRSSWRLANSASSA